VIDETLRRSAAHILVEDPHVPVMDEATAHHVRRVLRVREGEPVTVTDGAGAWRSCRLVGSALEPDGDVVTAPAPRQALTLAVAMPKGERQEWLVQKATEVGIDRVVACVAERSVAQWDDDRSQRQLERLRRIALEAALQSRRVRVPVVEGPVPVADLLPTATVAEPGGRPLDVGDTTVVIGPEGGWTPAELDKAWASASLGDTVLRVETAAVVAATMMVGLRRASGGGLAT
jgi:16S rRNA (uracil1498-N3)-methyltransferase